MEKGIDSHPALVAHRRRRQRGGGAGVAGRLPRRTRRRAGAAPRRSAHRRRRTRCTGAARPLPARAYPAQVTREATVDRDATVAFEGNRYGVTPSLIGQPVTVRHRLGSSVVEVVTAAGLVVAAHERAAVGAHGVLLGR